MRLHPRVDLLLHAFPTVHVMPRHAPAKLYGMPMTCPTHAASIPCPSHAPPVQPFPRPVMPFHAIPCHTPPPSGFCGEDKEYLRRLINITRTHLSSDVLLFSTGE